MRRPARQPRNRRAFRSFQERRGHRDGLSVDGGAARGTGAIGDVVIADAPVSIDGSSRFVDSNGYRFFAGLRSDPHFKDGIRVTAETLSCREPRSAVLGLSLLAGASLQSQADRLAAQHRRQVRALLPAVVGLAVILMVGEFLLLVPVNRIAAAVALLATILLTTRLLMQLPREAVYWSRGEDSERLVAEHLRIGIARIRKPAEPRGLRGRERMWMRLSSARQVSSPWR